MQRQTRPMRRRQRQRRQPRLRYRQGMRVPMREGISRPLRRELPRAFRGCRSSSMGGSRPRPPRWVATEWMHSFRFSTDFIRSRSSSCAWARRCCAPVTRAWAMHSSAARLKWWTAPWTTSIDRSVTGRFLRAMNRTGSFFSNLSRAKRAWRRGERSWTWFRCRSRSACVAIATAASAGRRSSDSPAAKSRPGIWHALRLRRPIRIAAGTWKAREPRPFRWGVATPAFHNKRMDRPGVKRMDPSGVAAFAAKSNAMDLWERPHLWERRKSRPARPFATGSRNRS